jgi:uncharacterized membrane protein YkvA (DUF1232 family)
MSGHDKASPDVNDFDPEAEIAPGRAIVPSVMKLNERRVDEGFWPKIRRVAAKVPFAQQALAVWFCAKDDDTPMAAKGMMLAALAYFVLPTDAVPDFIVGLGYTDDAAVFMALLSVLGKNLKPRHHEAAKRVVETLREEP